MVLFFQVATSPNLSCSQLCPQPLVQHLTQNSGSKLFIKEKHIRDLGQILELI